MASSVERPNIRIEIQNNVREVEAMEVDEEEGEIVEKYEEPQDAKLLPPADALGVAEKLAERARRFDLRPDETNPFTRSDLDDLYSSLGIDPASAADLCGDAILARADPATTSSDVLVYFYRYAPVEVGWLDDDGWFIVRFPDGGAAARALFYLSRPIDGVPVRRPTDALIEDEGGVAADDNEEAGRSVLLRDRHVELSVDGAPDEVPSFAPVPLQKPAKKFKNSVDVSEVNVPIPPGYWRLGGPIGATEKGVLMRFGSKTDKKPFKVESLGRGYKKPGQISERQLRELRSIFQRNKHMQQDRNPWGTLARRWDEDQLREPERRPELTGQFDVKNPDLLERLGRKAQHSDAEDGAATPPPDGAAAKRAKVPRMRMYADEEEEKVRRKKLLRTLRAQETRLAPSAAAAPEDESRDLRAMLTGGHGRHSAPAEVITIDSDHDRDDLSLRLRNRTRNMVFTVRAREEEEEEEVEEEREGDRSDKSDVRSFLDRRRSRRREHTETRRSPVKRTRAAETYSAHARSHHTHHQTHRRRPDRSPGDGGDSKPRSRVAVVVRKAPTKPTVASTIWRPEAYTSSSGSSSSSSSDGSGSSESSSEDGEVAAEEVEEKRRSGGRVKVVRLGARR